MTVKSSSKEITKIEDSFVRPRIIPRVEDIISGRASINSVVEQYSKQLVDVQASSLASKSSSSQVPFMDEDINKDGSSYIHNNHSERLCLVNILFLYFKLRLFKV
jgi:hypothetical protein